MIRYSSERDVRVQARVCGITVESIGMDLGSGKRYYLSIPWPGHSPRQVTIYGTADVMLWLDGFSMAQELVLAGRQIRGKRRAAR
jgi:hypothetical protein